MNKILSIAALAAAFLASASCTPAAFVPEDGVHTLELLSTNDVHGSWFDSTYTGGALRNSLFAAKWYADSVRAAAGADNVLLLDAGDCLQGDNGAYYFNYVDTVSTHLYPRLAAYMGYDAVAVGNHDIETGHAVYDRVAADLAANDIAFLAGNAFRTADGKPYFAEYKTFIRSGLKVAVLGFTNANIKAWLSEELWSGMSFESLVPLVQEDVDKVIESEQPQVVVVAVHSGTGEGDGSVLESQGLDLFKSLRGVDFLLCSHDHKPVTFRTDSICLINSGSHCRNFGHGTVSVEVKDGKVVSKKLDAGLIAIDAENVDTEMRDFFHPDFEAVKAFTLKEVGCLATDFNTADSYAGMSDYMSFIHAVQLSTGAQVSMAAPLTYDGHVKAGKVIYNDLFTIYPYENQLFHVLLTGAQIKDYLEASYDNWVQTWKPGGHALKIEQKDDPRTGQKGWSFTARSYNFDSAGGLVYEVDITKAKGERVSILSMADGSEFCADSTYTVAMTSYRANGGGSILSGAGIDPEGLEIAGKLHEIRNIIYEYFLVHGTADPAVFADPKKIGLWKFVPESDAKAAVAADMKLLFR